MRRLNQCIAALAAAMLLPLAAQAPMAQSLRPAVVDAARARVIVQYRGDSEMMKKQAMTATGRRTLQAQGLGDRIGVPLVAGAGISDRSHVVTARGMSSASLAARLSALADVEYAVVDERKHIVAVPNDTFYASRPVTTTTGGPAVGQWYLKPPGPDGNPLTNTAPAAINAEQAWDVAGGGGSASIVVAVLDTGLRFDHPDLLANVVPGYDMIAADDSDASGLGGSNFSTANDNSGRDADASDLGDWVTAAEKSGNPIFTNCDVSSSSWHGTQTLGLIGATTNNGAGIASVGNGVKVMPVRVLGKCGGYDSDILVGMLWAAGVYSASELTSLGLPANANPAKVISMSLGSTGACSQPYRDAMTRISAANVVVVSSAGNTEGHSVSTPANCPGVIAVGGLRHLGDKVGFSDLGPEITISAPAGNCVLTGQTDPCLYPIMTTANSGTTTPVAGAAGATYTGSFGVPTLGTSFSAPLVAGTAALMLSVKPSLTPAQVRSLLQATARPFPTTGGSAGIPQCMAPIAGVDQDECYCTTTTCGAGMLDAHAALVAAVGVQAAISVSTPTPTAGQPVTVASTSVVGTGQSVTYLWAIVSAGATGATISGASNAATVTVMPTAAGVFTISLTTTDNNGYVSTATTVVTVAAASTAPSSPSGGGGGGGALGVGWLMLLLSAVLALAAVARFERRRAARALSGPARAGRRR
jgi:serine protease